MFQGPALFVGTCHVKTPHFSSPSTKTLRSKEISPYFFDSMHCNVVVIFISEERQFICSYKDPQIQLDGSSKLHLRCDITKVHGLAIPFSFAVISTLSYSYRTFWKNSHRPVNSFKLPYSHCEMWEWIGFAMTEIIIVEVYNHTLLMANLVFSFFLVHYCPYHLIYWTYIFLIPS